MVKKISNAEVWESKNDDWLILTDRVEVGEPTPSTIRISEQGTVILSDGEHEFSLHARIPNGSPVMLIIGDLGPLLPSPIKLNWV